MALVNNLQELTIQEAEQLAASVLLENLGVALLGAELALTFAFPLFGFVAIGFAIADLVSLFGSGKPKTVDTNNVIRAYNMSAYWPLHALATNLTIALRNGAPISDSRPQIQAEFGVWKQGTVTSLQQFAGAQPGSSGDGYWQIFQLIEISWQFADDYSKVLDTVRAIDAFTIGLSQLEQQQGGGGGSGKPPPISGGGGGFGGGGGSTGGGGGDGIQPPCPPFQAIPDCLPQPGAPDPALDEIGQGFAGVAYWLEVIAIYLMNIFQKGAGAGSGNGGNADPVTCTQLTGLFKQLTEAIAALNSGGSNSPPPDLSAIATALEQIATSLTTAPGPLVTPTVNVPAVPPAPNYGPSDFANDLEAAKEQLLGETQVFGA